MGFKDSDSGFCLRVRVKLYALGNVLACILPVNQANGSLGEMLHEGPQVLQRGSPWFMWWQRVLMAPTS